MTKPMFAWTVRVTDPEMLKEIKDDLKKYSLAGVTFRKDSGLSGTAEDLHGLLMVQESCYANMENGNDHRAFGIYFCDHGTAMDDSRWDALNKGADCEWEELETTGGWGLTIIGA